MIIGAESRVESHSTRSRPADLRLAGALMVAGWALTIVATAFHPAGHEDEHETVFAEYATSESWVAVHLAQFAGVLLALGGIVVLCTVLRAVGPARLLGRVAGDTAVATAAVWAVLQALDGVALKRVVDAWAAASEAEERLRMADAEVLRWLEWGLQSYFRLLLGVMFILVGVAVLRGRPTLGWVGWAAVLAGALSLLIGVDVGYSGLASGLQDAAGLVFLVVGMAFAVGVLVAGFGRGSRQTATV